MFTNKNIIKYGTHIQGLIKQMEYFNEYCDFWL